MGGILMPDVLDLQRMVLHDPAVRDAFAANPHQSLTDDGITIPAGVDLPQHIDRASDDRELNQFQTNQQCAGASLDTLDRSSPQAVPDFIAVTVPCIHLDLNVAAPVIGNPRGSGDAETIA